MLKYYATNSNIAQARHEIAALRKAPNETSARFADVMKTKIVQCESAYSKERTENIYIDGFPASIQSVVRTFWSREQNAHLLEIARYADMLLKRTLQGSKPGRVAPYTIRSDRGRRSRFVTTVVDQGPRAQEPIRKNPVVHQEERHSTSPTSGGSARSYKSHHYWVCLSTDHDKEKCSNTVRSDKLANLREAYFQKRLGSRRNSDMLRGAYNRSRPWIRNQHPGTQPSTPARIEGFVQMNQALQTDSRVEGRQNGLVPQGGSQRNT